MSIIIPLAFLFATLVTFAKLSADGELTAMLAAGISLTKLMQPVVVLGLIISVIGALCSLHLEPWANRNLQAFSYEKAQSQLDNFIKVKLKPGVFIDGFLGYVLYTEGMKKDKSLLTNVMIAPGRQRRDQKFTIYAPTGAIQGSVESGNLMLNLTNGTIYTFRRDNELLSTLKFGKMELDLLRVFKERIFSNKKLDSSYESMPLRELKDFIVSAKKTMSGNIHKALKKAYVRLRPNITNQDFCLKHVIQLRS